MSVKVIPVAEQMAREPQMVNMPVLVPAGVRAGAQLQVTAPNGQVLMVAVPAGVAPGQQFMVQVPAAPSQPAQAGGMVQQAQTAAQQTKASVEQKFKAWYAHVQALRKGTPTDTPKKPYHDRSAGCGREMLGVLIMSGIIVISFIPAMAPILKEGFKSIGGFINLAISLLVAFVFCVGGPLAGWMDARMHPQHELMLLRWAPSAQSCATCTIGGLLFGVGVSVVFQLIADCIQASLNLFGIGFIIAILGLVIFAPFHKSTMPSFRDCWEIQMRKLHNMKANKATGKKKTSRFAYYRKHFGKILKAPCTACPFTPARFGTFARITLVSAFVEGLLPLLAAGWFINRAFSVTLVMRFFFLGGTRQEMAADVAFTIKQRNRISKLDYGSCDPKFLMDLKKQLALKFNMPDLWRFKLPTLSLEDLLALLPDLPNLPNIDFPSICMEFPSLSLDLPTLKLKFPNVNFDVPGFKMPVCKLLPNFDGLDLSLDIDGLDACCAPACEGLMENLEEIVGALLSIVMMICENAWKVQKAIDEKKLKALDAAANVKAEAG